MGKHLAEAQGFVEVIRDWIGLVYIQSRIAPMSQNIVLRHVDDFARIAFATVLRTRVNHGDATRIFRIHADVGHGDDLAVSAEYPVVIDRLGDSFFVDLIA